MAYIPQIEPWISDLELTHVTSVLKSTFITENAKTEEFLQLIRNYVGTEHAIATTNGTLGLVAALLAEGIGPGDEVIIPDLTFIATANAVRLVGAAPVLCDVDLGTGCMNVETCLAASSDRTRAIMPVHLYGFAAPMPALVELAEAKGWTVIEDAAESLGVFMNGRHTGTFGHYGVFSFFANKVVTCGEGGVVLTDSRERLKALFRVKNHGRDRRGVFIHDSIGYNFCFTDLQAAIGVAQFEKLRAILEQKRTNFLTYREAFHDLAALELMTPPADTESNYWFNNVLVADPEALANYLEECQIGTRRLFYPLHMQPCYAGIPHSQGRFPNSVTLYERGLSLPSAATLDNSQRSRVCQAVRQFFGK